VKPKNFGLPPIYIKPEVGEDFPPSQLRKKLVPERDATSSGMELIVNDASSP